MLDRARERGGYDELIHQEVTAFLDGRPAAFDLAVCADTLPYFGELPPLFAAAARALLPDGRFIATLELLEKEGASFQLGVAGRYAHAHDYATRALEEAGLRVERAVASELRREYEVVVRGLVVTARRRSPSAG
jgi:predicted TPR repeat methyltransferase